MNPQAFIQKWKKYPTLHCRETGVFACWTRSAINRRAGGDGQTVYDPGD
jgi:hypothetical protein